MNFASDMVHNGNKWKKVKKIPAIKLNDTSDSFKKLYHAMRNPEKMPLLDDPDEFAEYFLLDTESDN